MGNSLPPLCLETHKHMGTTFQGIQISTLPLTEESARHHQSVPAVDMVASWHMLGEYGCTLIAESGLCHRSTQSV